MPNQLPQGLRLVTRDDGVNAWRHEKTTSELDKGVTQIEIPPK